MNDDLVARPEIGGRGFIQLYDVALAVVVENGDRFPTGSCALEDINAGLPAVFDTNRVFGHTKALIGVENDIGGLLAQKRHVLHVFIAREDEKLKAHLVVSHALERHVELVIDVSCKQKLHPRALFYVLELACRKRCHVVPRRAADELSDCVFRDSLGLNQVIVLRGHGLEFLGGQNGLISVGHTGVGARVVSANGSCIRGGLLL